MTAKTIKKGRNQKSVTGVSAQKLKKVGKPRSRKEAKRDEAVTKAAVEPDARGNKSREDRRRGEKQGYPHGNKKSALITFQRCRAVEWRPCPVAALSVCPDQSAIAVAREDGSINVWDTTSWTCILEMVAPEDMSTTAMCWVWDRVSTEWRFYSCGLNTLIIEWDLRQRLSCCTYSSLGGAVWHMAAQPQNPSFIDDDSVADPLVAVATDDGAVRVHNVESGTGSLSFLRMLIRSDAKALRVAWQQDAQLVFAGFGDGCVSIIDINSGAECHRITVAGNSHNSPACVWTLLPIPGGALATGTARGAVQVFETKFGTQQSFCHHHQADVTCLAVSPCGGYLFAAGMDPSLVLLTPNQAHGPHATEAAMRFSYSDRRRPHQREVRAMEVVCPLPAEHGRGSMAGDAQLRKDRKQPPLLVTAGNDAQVMLHSADRFQEVQPARVTAAPCAPRVAFSASRRFVAASKSALEVWQAAGMHVNHGKKRQKQLREGDSLCMKVPPVLLARIAIQGAPILATCISPCGRLMAAASAEGTSLYALRGSQKGNDKPAVAAVLTETALPAGCTLCFIQSPSTAGVTQQCWLFIGTMDGRLVRLHVDTEACGPLSDHAEVELPEEETRRQAAAASLPTSQTASLQMRVPFSHITACPSGRRLAVASLHAVHVLAWDDCAWAVKGCLALTCSPRLRPITALALVGNLLALATTEERLELYDAQTLLKIQWLQKAPSVAAKLEHLGGHVHSLCFRHSQSAGYVMEPTSLSVCSNTRICMICLDSVKAGIPMAGTRNKRRHVQKPEAMTDRVGLPIRMISVGEVLFGATWLDDDSFLMVEGEWGRAVQQLPAPVRLKSYGS